MFPKTIFKPYGVLYALALLSTATTQAQTDMDAIMMNRSQFCSGLDYMRSSWDHYWEGKLNRTNENLGTVTTQSVMFMPNYGITNNLNVMASASYVWTQASAGTLKGMKGLQDIAAFVKWRPVAKSVGKSKVSLFLVGGYAAPLSNYVVDHLPLSLGLGSKNWIGRGMVDYQYKRLNVTGSAAYIRRSNVSLDRTAYYDTQLHLANEVKMPDAAQYQLRAGYRGKYLLAEALLNNWTTLGGFDITRNNMPFPSNRMNSTSVGFALKYTLKQDTHFSLIGGGSRTIAGRNMGQATAFNIGAFYVFYFKK